MAVFSRIHSNVLAQNLGHVLRRGESRLFGHLSQEQISREKKLSGALDSDAL